MKTNLITTLGLISFIFALSFGINAQTTIPNGTFETWQNIGASDEEPTNWNGNKTGGGFANLGPQTCFRESGNVHSGSYCMRLENGSFFGTPVNATGTTGKIEAPSTQASDGYIHTITSDPDFSSPFNGRPDSLVGWFRFTQGGSDIGRVQAILHDSFDVSNPDQGNSASHIIAEALYDVPSGSTSNWTRFSVPFAYNNGTVPSYILLIATASTSIGNANSSTIFWVDDLEVVYCSDAIASVTDTACNSYISPSGNLLTSTGIYNDTLVGANGSCDSIFSINLTINNVDTSVTDNGSSLTSNASTGASYQWVDCDNGNSSVSGETNASFTPTASGNYAVEVTQNGCTAVSSCFNITLSSIEQWSEFGNLSLFPNPNTGTFTIDLGSVQEVIEIRISDMNGRLIQTHLSNNDQKVAIQLDQPAGMYVVSIISETKQAHIKMIKQ